ncbi:hypothetical protein [Photobacterium jeanii]|nr:hypothetical protein [Photobacterium jeanii]
MAAKLAVVIHAEEEFDWHGQFSSANNQVSPQYALIALIEKLIVLGAKVTLAMDYAFVASPNGQTVIQHFSSRQGESIEFASHLHPWVNPPFSQSHHNVSKFESFPGNLPADIEREKLQTLTDLIHDISGTKPLSYLAGRHGFGANTLATLNELGYQVDLSICPYYDFSASEGPDFRAFDCRRFEKEGVTFLPHTSAVTSWSRHYQKRFNRHASLYSEWQQSPLKKVMGRGIGLRLDRLSPEGLSLRQMQRVYLAQKQNGLKEFVLSFHSSSLLVNATPYVKAQRDVAALEARLIAFVTWAFNVEQCRAFLPQSFASKLALLSKSKSQSRAATPARTTSTSTSFPPSSSRSQLQHAKVSAKGEC